MACVTSRSPAGFAGYDGAMQRLMACTLVVALASGAACRSSHPRDFVANRNPRSEFPPDAPGGSRIAATSSASTRAEEPRPAGRPPRVLARAASRAIATDGRRVYFGDDDNDAVLCVEKNGGTPQTLARRAPVFGALARDGDAVVWIGTPGDVILKTPAEGGATTTVRDRGIFTDLVADKGEVLVTEVLPKGGAVARIGELGAAKLGELESAPRGMAIDGSHVYVALAQSLVRVPRSRGSAETIAIGARLADPHVDDRFVYVTTSKTGRDAVVARVPKSGGQLEVIVSDVRPGTPTALYDGRLYYIGAARPELRALILGTQASQVVSIGDVFSSAVAMVADGDGLFLATGDRAEIVAVLQTAK